VTEKFSQMAEKNRLRSSQQGFGSICGFGLLGLSSLSRLSEEMVGTMGLAGGGSVLRKKPVIVL
jgi:hypothetical protein